MNIERYFKNLTSELESLKDRVRHYIDDAHWQSDGEWKESVLRTILRRHLPNTIGVGRGFIVNVERSTTQIDVLLFDKSKPILFQDGDFVITTPDAMKGAIEVKTKISQQNKFREAIDKLSNISQFINPASTYGKNHFYGLFSYEESDFDTETALQILQDCVNGQHQRVIHCISLGKDYFVRYWPNSPNSSASGSYNKWHSYKLKHKAPAYFVHNVVDHLCPQWTSDNNDIWYPENGKENHKISEIFLYKPEQIK